ncbi:hypothetical protein [Cohnella hongkongensis]|uniref:Uncharacterized protein n=1 Tax=Cohnella hongkongensis TaxID=178337 RepID=A0ABV9FLW3_9BACL
MSMVYVFVFLGNLAAAWYIYDASDYSKMLLQAVLVTLLMAGVEAIGKRKSGIRSRF